MRLTSQLATFALAVYAIASPLQANEDVQDVQDVQASPDATQIIRVQGFEGQGCDADNYKGEVVSLAEAGTSGCGRCTNPDRCNSIEVLVTDSSTYSCNVYVYTGTTCTTSIGTFADSLDAEGICFNDRKRIGSYQAVCDR